MAGARVKPARRHKGAQQRDRLAVPVDRAGERFVGMAPNVASRRVLRGEVPEAFEQPDGRVARQAQRRRKRVRLWMVRRSPLQGVLRRGCGIAIQEACQRLSDKLLDAGPILKGAPL